MRESWKRIANGLTRRQALSGAFKVFTDPASVATGQLYFPDAL
ncbi:MAG: hypothetical protein WBW37_14540 [Methyloceanibacter sp.]